MSFFETGQGLDQRPLPPGLPALPPRRFHPRSLAPEELDEGGSFDYGRNEEILLGRKGLGPLRLAWDTSILIDWAKYGPALLADDSRLGTDVAEPEPKHREELVALGTLMNLPWMTRDIRIHPLEHQLLDFRRWSPPESLTTVREHQVREIAAALAHVELDREVPTPEELAPGHPWEVPALNSRLDKQLVEEAVVAGCHVFLTRDAGILARSEQLAFLGLAVMAPTDLLDALVVSGELDSPFGANGLVCDNHKWQHLWALLDVPAVEED